LNPGRPAHDLVTILTELPRLRLYWNWIGISMSLHVSGYGSQVSDLCSSALCLRFSSISAFNSHSGSWRT